MAALLQKDAGMEEVVLRWRHPRGRAAYPGDLATVSDGPLLYRTIAQRRWREPPLPGKPVVTSGSGRGRSVDSPALAELLLSADRDDGGIGA